MWRHLYSVVALLVGTSHANSFDGIVKTPCGSLKGVPSPIAGVWAFRGIPYAETPQRFQAPSAKTCTSGKHELIDASTCGDVCVQLNLYNPLQVYVITLLCVLIMLAALCCGFAWYYMRHWMEDRIRLSLNIGLLAVSDFNLNSRKWSFCGWQGGGYGCQGLFCVGLATVFLIATVIVAVPTFLTNFDAVIGSEDCLSLNVFTPTEAIVARQKLPVMFWIHGGFSALGTGCDYGTSSGGMAATYGDVMEVSATGRVVSVTINYRLNVFGFLYLEGVNTTANAGIRDIIESLRWTQRNIAAFGGDPAQVTVYGQSAGGTLTFALLAAPAAKGLFKRAYSVSGSPKIAATKHQASKRWHQFFVKNLDCKHMDLSKCLTERSAFDIFNAIDFKTLSPPDYFGLPNGSNAVPMIPLEIVDGDTIIGSVHDVLAQGNKRLPAVPLLVSTTREEVDLELTQNTLWPMSHKAAVKWATHIVGESHFGDELWKLFKPNPTTPMLEQWERLATDLIITCPVFDLAHQVASSPGRDASTLPVYAFVVSHSPQNAHLLLGLFPLPWKHAFHMWDMELLFHSVMTNSFLVQYTFSPADDAVAHRLRSNVLDFATTGRIPGWPSVSASGITAACDVGEKTVCGTDLEVVKECELLKKYGLQYKYSVIN